MAWIYEQHSGKLYRPDGTRAATGYAGGNGGKNPEGVNNHDMQWVKNIGPICCGEYLMGKAILKSHLGPLAIPLVPHVGNDMRGRGSFFIHGDTTPSGNASEGCIIMPRKVREECIASEDKTLQVIP